MYIFKKNNSDFERKIFRILKNKIQILKKISTSKKESNFELKRQLF